MARRWSIMGIMLCAAVSLLAGCGSNSAAGTEKVQLVLDWTPNTNHTGLYAAKELGYFEEEGLEVDIVLPGESGADAVVASGEAQFGVSYQEGVTQARVNGVPLVSIAAVIQHNTSGFASLAKEGIKTPKDFEGRTYGGWGSPVEGAMIESLMKEDGGDFSKVTIASIGDSDFFTAMQKDIDFQWIYYGWTGIEAELRNEPLNVVWLTDYSEKLDYYTPVLVTNEKLISENPELVKKFLKAVAKGYQYAIDKPEEAADVLVKAVPELNKALVVASQKWLSPRYADDAPRWGEQKRDVWVNYADWMSEHGLLEGEFNADEAFTNEFLPK
ncbi:ABC transporter substrate-binding protein [Paenibacillus alkalitolerans]|uniref:ABC transporter substrate-binding protein n=1 Tax=Paenibacillus alkalitolerans TaxID=2799335 RepID=UPI0018F74253